MIVLHSTFPIREDQREYALEQFALLAFATEQEQGCIRFEFFVSLDDPNKILLTQEWQGISDLRIHYASDHRLDFLRELPRILSGEMLTRRYNIVPDKKTTMNRKTADNIKSIPNMVH